MATKQSSPTPPSPDEQPGLVPILPRSVASLDGKQAAVASLLQGVERERREVAARLDVLVGKARGEGLSWSAIGWAVGTSGEAARQRWGRS